MPDWGAALAALGQGFMQFPQFQQQRKQWEQENQRAQLEMANLEEARRLRDLQEQRLQAGERREQETFVRERARDIAEDTPIGSVLSPELWKLVEGQSAAGRFAPATKGSQIGESMAGKLPFLDQAPPSQVVGEDVTALVPEALRAPTPMERVPTFNEGQLIQQQRIAQQQAAALGRERVGQAGVDQRDDASKRQYDAAMARVGVLQQQAKNAQARGDVQAQVAILSQLNEAHQVLANITARQGVNRFTGQQGPDAAGAAAAAQQGLLGVVGKLTDALTGVQNRVPPGGGPPSPPPVAAPPDATGMSPQLREHLNKIKDPATPVADIVTNYRATLASFNPRDPEHLMLKAALEERLTAEKNKRAQSNAPRP